MTNKLTIETTTDELSVIENLFFCTVKTRKDILELAYYVENQPENLGEDPFPLFHSFANGMYTRHVHIPKDHIVVGKIHKDEYFINVLKGKLWCVSEFGAQELIAPCSFTAPAGVKHIVYTLEDSVWSDTSKTDKTNVEEAELDIFVDSYEELDKLNHVVEYENVINELGLTEQTIEKMLTTDDLIDQPEEDNVIIKDSNIQGKGVFTTKDVKTGGRVALARKALNRAPAGRYMNHSDSPNAVCVIEGENMLFFAVEDINEDSEVTVDYRNAREQAILLDGSELCQV